jgi:class 3 adenylate cyclase
MVFYLLENIYRAFHRIADTRNLFKVETIGDCCKYSLVACQSRKILADEFNHIAADVAVCGLPEPNASHAAVMVKFASSCRQRFNMLVSEMSTQLGPDTQDLMLRIGLHTGPVTAGVLRGQKSRFQLFGDTVNTAARMESNGKPDKIHVSQELANQLNEMGKGHWVTPRDSLVQAKGKGTIQTNWVEPTSRATTTDATSLTISNHNPNGRDQSSLVDWAADILNFFTKQVIAHSFRDTHEPAAAIRLKKNSRTVIDEFEEAIEIPSFDPELPSPPAGSIELSESMKQGIHHFVLAISLTYRGK